MSFKILLCLSLPTLCWLTINFRKVYVAIFDLKFSLSKFSCEFSKKFSNDNEAGIDLLAS